MSEITLEKQIGDTERRLEMRRERVARHLEEARAETDDRVRTGLKWAPLIVVGRHWRDGLQGGTSTPCQCREWRRSPPPAYRANGANGAAAMAAPRPNGTRSFATLASVAGVVARAALHLSQARELWRLYSSRHRH